MSQLEELTLTRHAGGRITVAAPNRRDAHDDGADALLLLLEACAGLPAVTPAERLNPIALQEARLERAANMRQLAAIFGGIPAQMMTPNERAEAERREFLSEIHHSTQHLLVSGELPRLIQ